MAVRSAVSLFSGCGGFCEGIELAGFNVLAAVEKDRFAAETYRFNFPEVPLYEGDVRDFLLPQPAGQAGEFAIDHADLVFGGPPCQGYSQIGTRILDDDRNSLYREFIRVLTAVRAPVFLMENVPNLLLMYKGHFKKRILADFAEAGYSNATYLRVLASDYGVPQDRHRVVFVGIRDGLDFPYDLRHYATKVLMQEQARHRVTVWEALGDLPAEIVHSGQTMPYPPGPFSTYQEMMRLDCDHEPYSRSTKLQRGIRSFPQIELHNHHTKEIQERRLALISILQPGRKANSLPKEVWNGTRPEKWRRLHPDLPSHTLLANMHRDMSEFVHPNLNRWITVREAARLQSFHDGFVFVGSEWQQLKQVGNAVPPLMARALGVLAQRLLDEVTRDRTYMPWAPEGTELEDFTQAVLPMA